MFCSTQGRVENRATHTLYFCLEPRRGTARVSLKHSLGLTSFASPLGLGYVRLVSVRGKPWQGRSIKRMELTSVHKVFVIPPHIFRDAPLVLARARMKPTGVFVHLPRSFEQKDSSALATLRAAGVVASSVYVPSLSVSASGLRMSQPPPSIYSTLPDL